MKKDMTLRERLAVIEEKLDSHLDSHKWLTRLIITLIGAEVLRQLLPQAYKLVEHASVLNTILPPLTGGG
jgi:hypothetical protein